MLIRLALLLLCTVGCGSPTEPIATGLAGTVFRGPTAPVCAFDQPCEAPFSAGFAVHRGSTRTATFRSDAQGHFEVRLSPGTYSVVPDSDAPIISPKSQIKEVVIGDRGLTMADLHFDTGIR